MFLEPVNLVQHDDSISLLCTLIPLISIFWQAWKTLCISQETSKQYLRPGLTALVPNHNTDRLPARVANSSNNINNVVDVQRSGMSSHKSIYPHKVSGDLPCNSLLGGNSLNYMRNSLWKNNDYNTKVDASLNMRQPDVIGASILNSSSHIGPENHRAVHADSDKHANDNFLDVFDDDEIMEVEFLVVIYLFIL